MASIQQPDAFVERPAAVLLDLDDTIYGYDRSHLAAMDAVTKKAQMLLSISPDLFAQSFGEARRQVKARTGRTAASHNRLLYFQRTLELLGLKTQVILSLDFEQTYWQVFMQNMVLVEGAKEFLQELRIFNIPTAIVTDLTAHTQFRKLVLLRIEEMIDFVVSSEEAGQDKPHEAPFQLALEKIGYTSGPVWMIGDDFECDGRGAREAVNAIVLLRRKRSAESGQAKADLFFDNFVDLRRLIAGTASDPVI